MSELVRKRKAAGLTQQGFARAVGVSARTVTAWESGETEPRPRHFPKIAKVLGVSADHATKLFGVGSHARPTPTP
jgi:transcriptional regulator with XRE-family HTH domain